MALVISVSDVALIPGFVKIGLLLRELYCFKSCKGVTQAGWRSEKPPFFFACLGRKACLIWTALLRTLKDIAVLSLWRQSHLLSPDGLATQIEATNMVRLAYHVIGEHRTVEPRNPSIYQSMRRYCHMNTEIFFLHKNVHDNRNASWRSQRCLIQFFFHSLV